MMYKKFEHRFDISRKGTDTDKEEDEVHKPW